MSIDRYKGFIFNPAALAEAVDLDLERRREILFVDGNLAELDPLRGARPRLERPPEAARAAYVEKVKLFHPDRYPGKRLGTFRPRLERVFRRLTEARDVLVDPERRTAYARATAPAAEAAQLEARKLEEERRVQERRARLARQNPLPGAGHPHHRAPGARPGGDGGRAASPRRPTTSPWWPGWSRATARPPSWRPSAASAPSTAKVQEWLDKAASAEAMEQWPRRWPPTGPGWRWTRPTCGLSILASRAALAAGDAAAAQQHAEPGASRWRPRNARRPRGAGRWRWRRLGRRADAKKAFEAAVDLDDRLESAKERLKKLRWSFLR